jgi:hypothetical protein
MYEKYTTDEVFDSPRANAICDFLFQNLESAFPAESGDPDNEWLFKSCILSGRAAAILRGAEGPINNIVFEIDRDVIYNWLVANLGQKIFNCPQISFKNRILLYPFPDLYFEFWYSEDLMDPVNDGSIFFQQLDNIPTQTL